MGSKNYSPTTSNHGLCWADPMSLAYIEGSILISSSTLHKIIHNFLIIYTRISYEKKKSMSQTNTVLAMQCFMWKIENTDQKLYNLCKFYVEIIIFHFCNQTMYKGYASFNT